MDSRDGESPMRGQSAPNLNNLSAPILATSPSRPLQYGNLDSTDPEAMIHGLQKSSQQGDGDNTGASEVIRKKKKKVKKSNIVEKTIENR